MASRMFGLMVVAWAGAAVGASAVESLFFARSGVANLPVMYIALGVITFPVTLGVSAVLARASRYRVLVTMPLALGGLTCLLRLLLVVDAEWVYPVLWLAMMVVWIVLTLDTWGLAGTVHDSRQAKRLFPLYGAGVILGGAVGGLLTPPLAERLHVENLVLVWGLSLIATWAVARSLPGGAHGRRRRSGRRAGPGLLEGARQGAGYVRRSRLLRSMSASILLSTCLYYVLSRVFAGTVTDRFPDPDRLAGFLGLFVAATNLGALVLSLVVANRLLSRLGVATALVTLPALYVVGFLWLVWTGAVFEPIVGFRLVQWSWMYGVWSIGWQALLSAIPPEHRQQARAFVDGGPMQWGAMMAGITLLLSQQLLSDRQLFALGAAIGAGAVAAAWSVKRAYRGALVDALRSGWPEVFVAEQEPFGGMIADRAARQTLSDAMADPNPAIRRVAAQILASSPGPEARAALLPGLGDADPSVRAAAVRAIARSGNGDSSSLPSSLLRDQDASVRAAAATAAGRDGARDDLVSGLPSLLSDPSPEVRVNAAESILRRRPDQRALLTLGDLASSHQAGERARALAALGRLAMEPETVVAGLGDPDPAPRRAAAHALASFGPERALEPLLEALADDDPTVGEAVADALAGLGDDVAGPVSALLDDPRREATVLQVLVRLPRVDAGRLASYARTEEARALHYHGLWRAIRPLADGRAVPLESALRHRALRHAEHAVRALASIGDRDSIDVALQHVTSRDANERAYALETLEATSDPELIPPLLAVWDPVPDSRPAVAAVLRPILDDEDPWIRACATFAAAAFADDDLQGAIRRLAAGDPDPTVRETAARALREDGPVETVPTLSLMDRMVALEQAPLFRAMSPEDVKHVAESLTENAYVDGTVIGAEGDPGDVMHVVVSGEVRVVRRAGQPTALAQRGPGYIVGEMSILADQPRMADLVAVGEVRTVSIDRARFLRILRERPDAALAVLRELSVRLLEANAGSTGSG